MRLPGSAANVCVPTANAGLRLGLCTVIQLQIIEHYILSAAHQSLCNVCSAPVIFLHDDRSACYLNHSFGLTSAVNQSVFFFRQCVWCVFMCASASFIKWHLFTPGPGKSNFCISTNALIINWFAHWLHQHAVF